MGVTEMVAMLQGLLLGVLAANVAASPDPQHFGIKSGIVGGQEAEPHQFPWQISLKYLDIWPHNIHTILPEDTTQKRKVADMWKHEGYDSSIITNDVSLLKLDEPLEFNEYVQPLPMAPKGDDPAGGTICVNSGWGSTSHSSIAQMPNKLQFVEMPIVSRPDCQEDYSGVNGVDDGMICGGIDEGGISACSGDSGGPFACPNENGTLQLSGIVSWGMIPCGQANRPSVFTSVGYFRDWIDEHLAL